MFPPQGLVAAALQPYSLISLLLTPNVTADSQILNAAPTASTVTAANAKSFTGTIGQIVLPAITPAANGGGITLTGLNFAQGAISNVADSEAITVKHIVMSFAAGAALETGVLTQTAIDITLANQAANAANNQATGIKITGGALAGGASAYQRGIDITMAAGTHNAIYVGTGSMYLGGALELTSTLTMANNTAFQLKNVAGTAQNVLYMNTSDWVQLNSPAGTLALNRGTATDIDLWGVVGTGRTLNLYGSDAADGELKDSPTLKLVGFYDADPAGGVTNTAFAYSAILNVTAGGAAPAASALHKINSVTVLTLTNTNGTPSVMIPGAGSYPVADTLLHIWNATAGSVTAYSGSLVTLENNNHTFLQFLVPNDKHSKILFGDVDSNTVGQFGYEHNADRFGWDIAGSARLYYSAGAFAFQEATTLSTSAGALTLQPVTGNGVRFADSAEGGTGSMNIKTVRQVVNLSGAQTSTTINIPAGAMLLGASFNVDTAVVTSAATNTWDADFTGGSVTNLVVAGTSGAQNTKANKLIVPEIASAQTNIEFDAPGAETFSSGAIEVVAYYIDQTSLANA